MDRSRSSYSEEVVRKVVILFFVVLCAKEYGTVVFLKAIADIDVFSRFFMMCKSRV